MKAIMIAYYCMYTLPDETYVSDPIFDGVYSMKSNIGCLFGPVQCVSTIVILCMCSQNIDTVYTMGVLSMYTSCIRFCAVIYVLFRPVYHCIPVVCILRKCQRISSGLSHPELQFRIFQHFQNCYSWERGVD
jgi:hypothetical protein